MTPKNARIKLSCLVTNYNQIEWIEEAIESILNQNMDFEYEILIGDDGSNDGSLELLKEKYGEMPQIRIFVQDRDSSIKEFPNWRHSRLIFRLLDGARGEYVSILDGDDYFYDTNHFRHKIAFLDKDKNKDCAAYYGNMYRLIDGKLELHTSVPYPKGKYQWQNDLIYIHLSTAVIRKKALENVPRDIYYEEFADWQITTWLAHKGLFFYDPAPCFVYRVLPRSIWHSVSTELNALRIVIVCELNYQAYGGKRISSYKSRRKSVITLYELKKLPDDIDYEMWNAFAIKYHAKVAHMLLNKNSLKLTEKIWLLVFYLRLKTPLLMMGLCRRFQGYCIGIGQLCSPKHSMAEKRSLIKKWWARITNMPSDK